MLLSIVMRSRCLLSALLLVTSLLSPAAAQLIQTVDYSDTFTVAEQGGQVARTDGSFNTGSPAYDVEDDHGNGVATWTPQTNFSFNTGLGSTCCGYPTNDGNAGASSGVAQSGGNDFSFAYGLRTNYTVQMDAILPPDRLDVSSLPNAGDTIFTAGSLSVFFRKSPGNIGLYNGIAESQILIDGLPLQTGVTDSNWHNYAVNFNQDDGTITLFVDGTRLAEVDLATFQGGAYNGYSNGAVGAGGTFVLWVDNFQVGEPAPTPTSACFSASPLKGPSPLLVDFNAACSFFAAPAVSYDWTFGDGGVASGPTAQHSYAFGGNYEVTLTIKDTGGAMASASKTITVFEAASSFTDDFERPDGPIDNWTVYQVPGTWNLAAGELTTGPSAEERWIWAGEPPVILPSRQIIEFDMRFLGLGNNAGVGRHAGVAFCSTSPTHRYDTAFSGYEVDWIDRPSDHGVRFTTWTNGISSVATVSNAAPSPAEPPLFWRVEIIGQTVRVYGDDVLYVDVVEATYRGGFTGFWTWAGGQEVAYDNVSITTPSNPLSACFTTTGSSLPTAGVSIGFDAGCTENAGAGAIISRDWTFGDGGVASGLSVAHAYAAPGVYEVGLTIKDSLGNMATASESVTVFQRAADFSDDFQRGDGPVDGWTVFSVPGGWNIVNGELLVGPSVGERWVWAGDTPIVFPRNGMIEWDQIFRGPGTNVDVGRHAGMAFCANKPTHRYDAGFTGYFVDWIDRAGDRGFRLSRSDGGVLAELVLGVASGITPPDDPPVVWTVEIDGDHIRLSGDGIEYFDVVDSTYRGGLVGLWTWDGGQEVTFDNVNITGDPLSACFTSEPVVFPLAGSQVTFDAACSETFRGPITAYEWTFGDGGSASGAVAQHTYAFADVYTVSLTVRDGAGNSAVLQREVTVSEPLLPFADCFDRAPGPVDGWTAALGEWNITADGTVDTITTAAEAFLYAGDPPRPLGPDFVSEVAWELVEGTNAVVGRHAAVHFFWNNLTTNRFAGDSRGYAVFYIDRTGDRGLTLGRWDGAALTVLNPPGGTPAVTEPPAVLGIEVTGPRIVVLADGVPVIDVMDETYRDGYFALWAWNDNTVRFDSVRIGSTSLPECGGAGGPLFVRGDSNGTGKIDLTDAVAVLGYLFLGQAEPGCFDSADADDNGQLQLTDAVRILGWLFLGNPPPPAPAPSSTQFGSEDCGTDPSEDLLGCDSFPPCSN